LAEPSAIRALHPSGTRRAALIVVADDEPAAKLRLASPIVDWLCGDDRLPEPLASCARISSADGAPAVHLPAAVTTAVDEVASWLADDPRAIAAFVGPRGVGRRAAAHRLARALGRALIDAPLDKLLELEKKDRGKQLVPQLLTQARLRGALVYLGEIDSLWSDGKDPDPIVMRALADHPAPFAIGAIGRGGANLPFGRPVHAVRMPRVDLEDRERAWMLAVSDAALAAELGGRYVIGPGAIAEVAAEAAAHAASRKAQLDRNALEDAVARRLSIRLGAFGTLITRKARFDEMVLPDDVVETLHDMIAMVRERSQILERWGYARHLGLTRGVSGLFSGEPGTGKTMAASVVASELGLELMRIDLSAIVSKYVGETEKNLGRVFDQAQDAHAMLLFDEADSLFGKRTEVKTAQDRYANLEVNYLLQRMETFDGVSVLTSNLEGSIDNALLRRLNFRIRFPEPEAEERVLLWQKLLPPETGLHAQVDFLALANKFEMTGGYIKNAVVRAAVIAARDGRVMTPDDLWSGAHHEYAEMGKVMPTETRAP
ncbi:MAG TPA: ATP-binding protein, partial [Kofleriaceae bacterium]|nr:ATP-binding protein [Kofleriaceae bacterium]